MVKQLDLRAILSQNIIAFRKANGLSQEDFAAHCGFHRTYVGSVERKERNVTLETLQLFSAGMRVTAATLLTPRLGKGESQ